jgi:hypothetical protein
MNVDPAVIPLGDADDQIDSIKALCIRLIPAWKQLRLEDLETTPISGGISNLLLKVSPKTNNPKLDPVAFKVGDTALKKLPGVWNSAMAVISSKVFGNKTELLIDREQELKTLLLLNSFGFGAKVRYLTVHLIVLIWWQEYVSQMIQTHFLDAGPRLLLKRTHRGILDSTDSHSSRHAAPRLCSPHSSDFEAIALNPH